MQIEPTTMQLMTDAIGELQEKVKWERKKRGGGKGRKREVGRGEELERRKRSQVKNTNHFSFKGCMNYIA